MMDDSLEDIIAEYFYKLVTKSLLKVIKPDMHIDNVTEIDENVIDYIREVYGIEGIILDVDETIRFNGQAIDKVNRKWLDMVRSKLKVIVVSNGIDKRIQKFFNDRGVEYIGFAFKPIKKNFLKACKSLKLPPEKVCVVGDDIITDIYGGKRVNMKTILVSGGLILKKNI